jgi:hypothetical protein
LVERDIGEPEPEPAVEPEPSPYFSLGQWGLPINAIAVVWGLVVVINVGWPRAQIYGSGEWGRFAAPLATLVLIASGSLYFLLFQRKRTGTLAEHVATEIPNHLSLGSPAPSLEAGWIGQLAPGE